MSGRRYGCFAGFGFSGFRDAGTRTGGEGALWSVGGQGFSWSSSVSDINGVDLNFHATNLNPSNADRRAYGFQVRCLQVFIRHPVFLN